MGLLGPNLPEEYGCAGLNNVAYGLINQEMERADSGLRSFASVQGLTAVPTSSAPGDEDEPDQPGRVDEHHGGDEGRAVGVVREQRGRGHEGQGHGR